MKDWFVFSILFVVIYLSGMYAGNTVSDHKTFTDCATTGKADLFGGVSITCAPVRKEKQ